MEDREGQLQVVMFCQTAAERLWDISTDVVILGRWEWVKNSRCFCETQKKKNDILKNSGNQTLESKWLPMYGQKKMSSIMFQKNVSHAGLEWRDDRNVIFVWTITLMCL